MKYFVFPLWLMVLFACGGGPAGGLTSDSIASLNINGSGTTTDIDEANKFNLNIVGSNNTITIASDNVIGTLNITGSNNLVTFGNSVSLQSFVITGSDNAINIPAGSGISFTGAVASNTLIEY